MQNAAGGADGVEEYISKVRGELPPGAAMIEISGGNHEQYGSYGSPGYVQGLAYKDLPAKISEEEQRRVIAQAIALWCVGGAQNGAK